MLTSALINIPTLIKIPALPPQSLDYVERESFDLRLWIYDFGFSIADCGPACQRGASCKTHISLSKYFAHPYQSLWPAVWLLLWLAGLAVKDVPHCIKNL